MTYRDEKDALQARVDALGSKVRATRAEHQELQQELADAQRDLAAMQSTEAPPLPQPRKRLLLGLVGVGLAALGNLLWLIGVDPPRGVMTLLAATASIGLALGLLGLLKLTRQKLMLIAAILCLAEVALDPLSYILPWFASYRIVNYLNMFKWALYVASSVVLGIALLRSARTMALPHWLRNTAGWTKIAGGALSSVHLFSVISGGFSVGQALTYGYVLLYLAGSAALAVLFFQLLRPPRTS
jgi:hypothetical protein